MIKHIKKSRFKALSIVELSNNILLRITFWVIIASLVVWVIFYLKGKYKEQKTIWAYTKFLLDIQAKDLWR